MLNETAAENATFSNREDQPFVGVERLNKNNKNDGKMHLKVAKTKNN